MLLPQAQPALLSSRHLNRVACATTLRIIVLKRELIPDTHMLRAGADIALIPLEATRSLVFELNGSLKVESIELNGKVLTGFVQDAVGVGSLGPSLRVDLAKSFRQINH